MKSIHKCEACGFTTPYTPPSEYGEKIAVTCGACTMSYVYEKKRPSEAYFDQARDPTPVMFLHEHANFVATNDPDEKIRVVLTGGRLIVFNTADVVRLVSLVFTDPKLADVRSKIEALVRVTNEVRN